MQAHSNADLQKVERTRKLRRILLIVGFAVSAVLMSAASRGDLALDEVVSLQKAENAPTWLEIVTQNQNDNNHLLNTFFLRLIGRRENLYVYRIPAVLFGMATVATLGLAARRWGKAEPAWVVCLAGLSFPMILYCSEARGYAPAMFFAVASFELLQRCQERCTPAKLLIFWTSLCLGFLSHFSFVFVFAALGGWSLIHEKFIGASLRGAGVSIAKYYAVPAIFLAGVYLVYIRHMIILGGKIYSRWEVAGAGASYALGFADTPSLRFISVSCATALAGCGILVLFRQKRDVWLFFALALLVFPALVAIVLHPRILYFRYFMVCFPFFYLLLAFLFATWFRTLGKMKMIPVLLLLAITTGHLIKISGLLHLGRGHYRQALYDMTAATPGPVIVVGSDHDWRNGTLLEFYARFLPPSKKIFYIPSYKRNEVKPEWLIVHSLDATFTASSEVEVGQAGKYLLFATYPYCGSPGSGYFWFVYRRLADADTVQN
jgi:hypothetical protein